MLKVIFHVAVLSITDISYYLMAEASGDGKPLMKENLQDQRSCLQLWYVVSS